MQPGPSTHDPSKLGDLAVRLPESLGNSHSFGIIPEGTKKRRDEPGTTYENSLMLTHAQIWRAIDLLAENNGLSPSGLAKRAGLDATTFNVSKRQSRNGRLRWPSTESIAKILEATGYTLDDFWALVRHGAEAAVRTIPLLGFAQAGERGFFDGAGFPAGSGWDEVAFPAVRDANTYALTVTGDSMMPLYREGDTLIVSPAAKIKRGDRIVLKTRAGEVMAKHLVRKTPDDMTVASLNPDFPDRTIPLGEVEWMARILWTSQ